MSFEYINQLPTPAETRQQFPLSKTSSAAKLKKDQEIKDIITGKDNRLLLVIGPCSADNVEAVLDYCLRLAKVQEKVKEKIVMVPRVYTSKPRTTGEGYKGLLHQPDPEKASDLFSGILATRKLHMRILKETGMGTADELLYSDNYEYLSDLLSYVAIGARSVEDQQHRLTGSGLNVAVGMKNPTSGDYSVMLNSVVAAQANHHFIYRNWEVKTDGNPYAHTILRGSLNAYGQCVSNYHYEDLRMLRNLYTIRKLNNPACIVDTNHANSNKEYKQQIRIAKEVLHSCHMDAEVKALVKGFMIESYIEEGSQKVGENVYGKSITDPCLGWEDSERLILEMADLV